MSEHKHTEGPWVKTAESLPKEYEEVYAKHEDGSIRIARLSKSEGGCWQLATFLVDTKRPGYAWPIDKVVEWRAIQPDTALSVAAPELLSLVLKRVKNEEQRFFEVWLDMKSPSGDAESVQRQWKESSCYQDFLLEWGAEVDAIAKATGAKE